eukprot:jgi/Mesvir1/16387/Mv18128-RA.1
MFPAPLSQVTTISDGNLAVASVQLYAAHLRGQSDRLNRLEDCVRGLEERLEMRAEKRDEAMGNRLRGLEEKVERLAAASARQLMDWVAKVNTQTLAQGFVHAMVGGMIRGEFRFPA